MLNQINNIKFKWWAKSNPLAFGILITGVLFIFLLTLFTIRFMDKGYDDPNEFEQVSDLHDFLIKHYISLKDSVTIRSNIFGSKENPNFNVEARIVGILSDGNEISIKELKKNYIQFVPEIIYPGKSKVNISSINRYPNLRFALESMEKTGFAQTTPPATFKGKTYSFELIWDIYYSNYPRPVKTVTEKYHFRADTTVKIISFIFILISACGAIFFIIDKRKTIYYFSQRKFKDALLAILKEIIKNLLYLREYIKYIPIEDVRLLLNGLANLLERLVKILERSLTIPDHNEELNSIRIIIINASELDNIELFLDNLLNQSQRIQVIIKISNAKNFTPLLDENINQDVSKLEKDELEFSRMLKDTVIEINTKTEEARKQHEINRKEKIAQIVDGMNGFLNGQNVKNDMSILGIPLPPDKSFETEGAHGKFEGKDADKEIKEKKYKSFSFPIPYFECETTKEDAIYVEIEKVKEKYKISEVIKDEDRKDKLGAVLVPAPSCIHENIKYKIKLELSEQIIVRLDQEIKIKSSYLNLIEPDPDPEIIYKKIRLP